ncbi:MAG TPA: hypothetical protein VFA58_04065 [Chthoniobacterales bacterium]|nr:hypothetical protein [Chthoniobacterales bacterium]
MGRGTSITKLGCAIVTFCLLSACHHKGEQTLEETIERNYPVEANATLSIKNRDGSIRVYGAGDELHEVRIEAIKKAYKAERLKGISVRVEANRNSISIDTVYPADPGPGFSDRSGTVDYVIVVPQSLRISNLELANGEVLLEGMRSDEAHASLGNGRLFAHNCFGNLDLHLKTGNLALVYEWWEDAQFSVRCKIEDGNSFAYIPSDATFRLIAHTATGKIANDFEEKEHRHAEPENKTEMTVGTDAKTLFQFETQDGNIKISEHNP